MVADHRGQVGGRLHLIRSCRLMPQRIMVGILHHSLFEAVVVSLLHTEIRLLI